LLRSIIYVLYRVAQTAAFPLLLLYLGGRVVRNRAYARGLGERFGLLPASLDGTLAAGVWLHAVSVGEVLAARGVIRALKAAEPGLPVFVSTTTLAGRALAEQQLAPIADGVFYAPLDYCFAVRAVLRRLRPACVVIMETEIWPNLYRESRRAGARLVVVNGRISDQAWPRYRRWRRFFAAVLSHTDEVLAQGAQAAARYRELLTPRVSAAGNLKYDFDPDATSIAPDLAAWLAGAGAGRTWIAASTMPPAIPGDPDEDELVLDAFGTLAARYADLLLILVPRRPERFAAAAEKLESAGIRYVRRSALAPLPLPGVLLLDTIGELAGLFRVADAVFLGGTIVHRGGHNPLEPAAFAKPLVYGPHMENFPEIAAAFDQAQAYLKAGNAAELARQIARLLDDPALRQELGAQGRELASLNKGATARAAACIQGWLDHGYPAPVAALWRRLPLGPLTLLWRLGVVLDRARSTPRRLPRPVVSIGNLSSGGTGKTPFTLWLAGELRARGHRPAILTRGYRSGEEAEIYRRAGFPVGQGRSRFASARGLDASVFLLDDGFQHWALERDLDIVLVDSLDPFAGGLLPLGRLRETPAALARAGIVVATRARASAPWLAPLTPAPVFTSRVEAPGFTAPAGPVGAFCALGNPASFRRTLAALDVKLEFFETFPDHHVYEEAELERLFARAPALLTTAKDWLNLPPAWRERVGQVAVRVTVDSSERLLRLVEERLRESAGNA
jgi:3-deoxy-D-manno-octulosonic-acid transferase/tetraacyldisaccharide-1-P 4'-kinase